MATSCTRSNARPVDWARYSKVYDYLLDYNPAYQEILAKFRESAEAAGPNVRAIDIGAGTGNFSAALANLRPGARIDVVEPDPGMADAARMKLARFPQIAVFDQRFEDYNRAAPVDLIIAVHSLYVMRDPQSALRRMRDLLEPRNGIAFICDIGRRIEVADWRAYIFASLVKRLGPIKATGLVWKGREIAAQNRKIAAAQDAGDYWLHSSADFVRALEGAGFALIEHGILYRGYSDYAIARAS